MKIEDEVEVGEVGEGWKKGRKMENEGGKEGYL